MAQTNTLGGIGGGEPNVGYVADIWLIDARDVLDLAGPPVTGYPLVAGALALTDGAVLTHLRFGPKACTAEIDRQRSEAGLAYATTLAGTLPKPDPRLLGWLLLNGRVRWLVCWRDRNGMLWLGGQPGNAWRLDWTHGIADRNAITLTLTGLNVVPPWPLAETTLDAMLADPDFNLSFDLSFTS